MCCLVAAQIENPHAVISLKISCLQMLKGRLFHPVLYHYCSSLLQWLCCFERGKDAANALLS